MVYRFGLENRRGRKPTVGSNPTSSAISSHILSGISLKYKDFMILVAVLAPFNGGLFSTFCCTKCCTWPPQRYAGIEARQTVWISLHTDSEKVANRREMAARLGISERNRLLPGIIDETGG